MKTISRSALREAWRDDHQRQSHAVAQSTAILPAPPQPTASKIKDASASGAAPPKVFRVVPSYINVRAKPSTSAALIARRFQGDCFEVDLERNGWVRGVQCIGDPGQEAWTLIDGKALGLGILIERLPPSLAAKATLAPPHGANAEPSSSGENSQLVNMLLKPPKSADGPLPTGVRGPVRRWRVLRPMTAVYGKPDRTSPMIDAVLQNELVWTATDVSLPHTASGEAASGQASSGQASSGQASSGQAPPLSLRDGSADGGAVTEGSLEEWHRLADPDGWVHVRCPAGFPQLDPDGSRHAGLPEREVRCPCLPVLLPRPRSPPSPLAPTCLSCPPS